MAKLRLHPANIIGRIQRNLSGHSASFLQMHESTSTDHEAALTEWETFRKAHIPGFKFSKLPRRLRVRVKRNWNGTLDEGWTTTGLQEQDIQKDNWPEVVGILRSIPWDDEPSLVPLDWQYSNIVPPNDIHSPHDEPNPCLYDLNGFMVKLEFQAAPAGLAGYMCETFEARLCVLFNTTPRNDRRGVVEARLNHHYHNGDNPEAFIEYVHSIPSKFDVDPPLIVSGNTHLLAVTTTKPLPDLALLIKYIEAWLESTLKDKPKDNILEDEYTFAKLWGAENLQAVRKAMTQEAITHVTDGRGKERVIAAFHAGAMKYGHPKRLKHWRLMFLDYFPGTKWSDKAKPQDLDEASDRYKAAFTVISARLGK